jgi:hypothetical protein
MLSRSPQLRRTVRLARLCEAASLLDRGQSGAAESVLLDLNVGFPSRTTRAQGALQDGVLTPQLLTPGLTSLRRREMIEYFTARHATIGPADARTLAYTALFENEPELRDAAQTAIRRTYFESPEMMLATLDMLGRAAPVRSAGLVGMLEAISGARLPDPRDGRFIAEVRRALAERLLDVRPSAVEDQEIDLYAILLATAYRGRDDTSGTEVPIDDADLEAWRVYLRWRERAMSVDAVLPMDPDSGAVHRRVKATLALCPGSMHRFAAVQLGIVESIAAVLAAEHPDREGQVRAFIQRLRIDLAREGQSVLTQIERLERGTLELWILRIEAAVELLEGT